MENKPSHNSNTPLSLVVELRQKVKNKAFWIHTGCLLFLLLYALKPIIGSSDTYRWAVSVLEIMALPYYWLP